MTCGYVTPSFLLKHQPFSYPWHFCILSAEPADGLYIPHMHCYNTYASTEAGCLLSVYELKKPMTPAPVGRSYSDVKLIVADENGMEIVVNFDPERFVGVQDTMQVTVWFDGMMSRSLPAQITAEHIRTQVLTGTITELTEEGFMMVDDNGILTFVHVSEATRLFTEPAVAAAVRVTTDGTATMSLPAQVTAIEVLPVEDAAEPAEEPVIEG